MAPEEILLIVFAVILFFVVQSLPRRGADQVACGPCNVHLFPDTTRVPAAIFLLSSLAPPPASSPPAGTRPCAASPRAPDTACATPFPGKMRDVCLAAPHPSQVAALVGYLIHLQRQHHQRPFIEVRFVLGKLHSLTARVTLAACAYACIARVHARTHARMHVHHARVCARTHADTHTHTRTHTHIKVHFCVLARTRARARAHTHTHTGLG